MSDLLSLLGLGATAIQAQNSGVATATNNVANINTDGYSRESVTLDALLGPPTLGGVLAGATTRSASDLLSNRIRDAAGSLGSSQATSDQLADLEATLAAGPSITDKLSGLFAKLEQVSAAPTDKTARDSAVSSISDLVSSIHAAAATAADARTQADQQVTAVATQANTLASQLAAANKAVQTSSDPAAADHRDQLAKQLAQLVGGQARIDPDGQLRFVLDGGAVLVDGAKASTITTTPDPVTGLATVQVADGATTRDVTSQIAGGQLGGTLAARSEIVAVAGQYDQYAYDLATSFNTVASANAGLDGVSGRAMFVAPTSVAGAAAALAIDPGLAANSGQLATAAAGAGPGDNTGALALIGLSQQKVATGNTRTLADAALDVPAGLAQRVATAKAATTTDELVASHLGDLRDSLAGVDATEEETNLSRFESASAALTKFVAAISDMLSNFITNV